MIDILIMGIDKTHKDPIKDRGCYKRGDIVEVFEGGKMQTPPVNSPFLLVRVNGVTKAQADKYIVAHIDVDEKILKRRLYNIDFSLLPLKAKTILQTKREITVTASQLKTFIRNKVTNKLG